MIEEKDKKLERLKAACKKANDSHKEFVEMFVAAVQARATALELSNATDLSVEQIRYLATKNRVAITPAQRGPKTH